MLKYKIKTGIESKFWSFLGENGIGAYFWGTYYCEWDLYLFLNLLIGLELTNWTYELGESGIGAYFWGTYYC